VKIQPIGFSGSRDATSAPTNPQTKKIIIAIRSFAAKCHVTIEVAAAFSPSPVKPRTTLNPNSAQGARRAALPRSGLVRRLTVPSLTPGAFRKRYGTVLRFR
jgi:hypothetical protein